jgi:hypothetical protein
VVYLRDLREGLNSCSFRPLRFFALFASKAVRRSAASLRPVLQAKIKQPGPSPALGMTNAWWHRGMNSQQAFPQIALIKYSRISQTFISSEARNLAVLQAKRGTWLFSGAAYIFENLRAAIPPDQ